MLQVVFALSVVAPKPLNPRPEYWQVVCAISVVAYMSIAFWPMCSRWVREIEIGWVWEWVREGVRECVRE